MTALKGCRAISRIVARAVSDGRRRFLGALAIGSTLLLACSQTGEVAESGATTMAVTTSRASTSTSAAVRSTSTSTSTPTATAQIVLQSDGLGEGLEFGMDGDEAVDTVSGSLGSPSYDDWEQFVPLDSPVGDNTYGDAPDGLGAVSEYPYFRMACWDTLCLEMDSADGSAWTFAAWSYASEIDREKYSATVATPVGRFSTPSGITLGTTWGDVRASHPEVSVDWGEGGAVGFVLPGWEPSFNGAVVSTGLLDFNAYFIEGLADDELLADDIPDEVVVTSLFAGDGLDFGCC